MITIGSKDGLKNICGESVGGDDSIGIYSCLKGGQNRGSGVMIVRVTEAL